MNPETDRPTTPFDGEPPRSELPPSELPPESADADVAAEAPPSPVEDASAASSGQEDAQASSDVSAAAVPPEPPPRRAASVGALVGASILGAAIALAVAAAASLFLLPRAAGVHALETRLAAIEAKVRELAAAAPAAARDAHALDDLAGRVAKLEAAGAAQPAAADGALANRLAGLEGEVKALADTIGALGHRTDEAVAAAGEARTRAENTAAALTALTQKVAAAAPIERSEVDARFEALSARLGGLERNEKAVTSELAKRTAAESGDRAVRVALAATALDSAVERGDPFAAQLATAKALVADPKALAPLEPFADAGVPSAGTLARALAELAPALRQTAAAPSPGFLQRLQANAEKLVRIRPLDEVAGNDSGAIVTRIEVKAAHGDLSGALAELAQLPPAERAPAESWIKQAQARAAAIEASRRFAADALAGLSK
ncbi:MAG TPA: hypothetical protein VH934_21595 [Xanthobacteraceae bacterium]